MNKREIAIIIFACLITAVLVGFEVYLWQRGSVPQFMPGLPVSIRNAVNPIAKTVKPKTNFDEIKTKEEGVAVCEYNRSYAQTMSDIEQKKMSETMADYCYAVIAGRFNDLNLCKQALDKNNCEKTANEFIEMGKEIQKLSPEEKQQLQDIYKNMYKP